jgi:hypothetical protein
LSPSSIISLERDRNKIGTDPMGCCALAHPADLREGYRQGDG